MITLKNIVILIIIESAVFCGGIYYSNVLTAFNAVEAIQPKVVNNHSDVDHVAKKNRIRLGNTKIVNTNSKGWGF